jgi:hypothetical protein
MQHLGRNFNDLPTLPSRVSFGGVGGSGVVSSGADGGSTASGVPVDLEAESESEGNPNDFVVQANPRARQGAAGKKPSLEANVTARSGSVPKRPYRACTLRPGKCKLEVTPCSLIVVVF